MTSYYLRLTDKASQNLCSVNPDLIEYYYFDKDKQATVLHFGSRNTLHVSEDFNQVSQSIADSMKLTAEFSLNKTGTV